MTPWTSFDTWIAITGALVAMACAIPGCFLVLRRMSMMSDAISHAVLPGLAASFLITGSREGLPMFLGAVILGLLTAFLVEVIQRGGNVDEGASMGVVFTGLFALGLIMIRQAADKVDLDPSCVLYGAIELAPLNAWTLLGYDVPWAAISAGAMLCVNAGLVWLLFKELRLACFDAAFAKAAGFFPMPIHYGLMAMTAATAVAAFESVGSILVIAMMIVPAAAAYLLTDRLAVMVPLAALIGALSAVLGHAGAIWLPAAMGFPETTSAGMMAAAAGLLFGCAWLFAPRHGLVARKLRRFLGGMKVASDDVLGSMYRRQEAAGDPGTASTVAQLRGSLPAGSRLGGALTALMLGRSIVRRGSEYRLTGSGLQKAARLIAAHRLWETYLAKEAPPQQQNLHSQAEALEHVTDERMRAELYRESGAPTHDPQHKKIPGQ